MKQLVLLIGLCCAFLYGKTQASDTLQTQTGLKAAVLGSLIYPGLKLGLERPYKVIQVEKNRRRGEKIILKERYLSANLGYYHHPTFHDNLYLLLERQKRRQGMTGWFREHAMGLGYSRTFLGGETYEVSEEGQVDRKKQAGHHYALFSFAAGGGYNFAAQSRQPIKIYGKLSLLGFFPSNSFIDLRPTLELGLIFTPTHFWKAYPKIIIKKK